MKNLFTVLQLIAYSYCLSPTFGTLTTIKSFENTRSSLHDLCLISPEYLSFISDKPLLKKELESFFKESQISWENPYLKFLDFCYLDCLKIKLDGLKIKENEKVSRNVTDARTSLFINLNEYSFLSQISLCRNMNIAIPIIKEEYSDAISKWRIAYDINLNREDLISPPAKTLRFLHDLFDLVLLKGYKSKPKNFTSLSFFEEVFEHVYRIPSYNSKVSFISLLQHLCSIASDFYFYATDATPNDIYRKFIFLAKTLESYFHFDQETSNLQLSTSKIDSLVELLDIEHISFMNLYKDLLIISFIQCLQEVDTEGRIVAVRKFFFTYSVLETIHNLVTLICNFSRIMKGEMIKVYSIDFDYILGFKNKNLFNANINQLIDFYKSDKSSCINYTEVDIGRFSEILISSFGLIIRLPIKVSRLHMSNFGTNEASDKSKPATLKTDESAFIY